MPTYRKSTEMRKRIMDTMEQLVRENGYVRTGIKELANALEVPRSLIYYYFKNKDDIMEALYDDHFRTLDTVTNQTLPPDEDPLVRLMMKYVLFGRYIAHAPLFNEFIVMHQSYASLGFDGAEETAIKYYYDSYAAFRHYGKAVDGMEFRLHVLMIEAVSRALIQGKYYHTVDLSERELIEYFGERTVMITFQLTQEQFRDILDRAFLLADQIPALK